jgi:hypothetical protein
MPYISQPEHLYFILNIIMIFIPLLPCGVSENIESKLTSPTVSQVQWQVCRKPHGHPRPLCSSEPSATQSNHSPGCASPTIPSNHASPFFQIALIASDFGLVHRIKNILSCKTFDLSM